MGLETLTPNLRFMVELENLLGGGMERNPFIKMKKCELFSRDSTQQDGIFTQVREYLPTMGIRESLTWVKMKPSMVLAGIFTHRSMNARILSGISWIGRYSKCQKGALWDCRYLQKSSKTAV